MKTKNRYCILTAGMVMQFCAGIIYGWAVFKGPVAAHLKWDEGAAAITSSIMLAMFVIGIIFGGYAQDKVGPKKITLAGSILIGIGMVCTSFVTPDTPWLVYITYGCIAGLGVGAVYMSTIAAVQKWFPDRRGFASGMIVCAFGFSLVVFAPLANSMLASLGVPSTFLIFGISFLVVCGTSSFFIANPPEGFLPEGFVPVKAANTKRQYSPKEIIKTKQYYLLVIALCFTLPAYFILNPVFLTLGADRGLSAGIAVIGVSLTGISNATGRLAVAWISDRTGRKESMVGIAVVILISSLVMIVGEGILFLLCIMLISFCFGGAASLYSTMTVETFGTKYGGMNFGLVMIGFGVSALVSQNVAKVLTAGGSFTSSFILAASTCVVAIILVLFMKNPAKSVEKTKVSGKEG